MQQVKILEVKYKKIWFYMFIWFFKKRIPLHPKKRVAGGYNISFVASLMCNYKENSLQNEKKSYKKTLGPTYCDCGDQMWSCINVNGFGSSIHPPCYCSGTISVTGNVYQILYTLHWTDVLQISVPGMLTQFVHPVWELFCYSLRARHINLSKKNVNAVTPSRWDVSIKPAFISYRPVF
jgi:hypothetical protein